MMCRKWNLLNGFSGSQVTKVARMLAAKHESEKSCVVMALLDGGTLRRHKSWLKVKMFLIISDIHVLYVIQNKNYCRWCRWFYRNYLGDAFMNFLLKHRLVLLSIFIFGRGRGFGFS